jgi:hypothetical protein
MVSLSGRDGHFFKVKGKSADLRSGYRANAVLSIWISLEKRLYGRAFMSRLSNLFLASCLILALSLIAGESAFSQQVAQKNNSPGSVKKPSG